MNALKSYSSEEDSDNSTTPIKQIKDGDPGTNYDSVGMDISEDSDEEKQKYSESSKMDGNKSCSSRNNDGTYSHVRMEKNLSRDSHDTNRESSSGSSRDSRESREHPSREARHIDDRDRRHERDHRHRDRRDTDTGRHNYDRRHEHRRYGRDRSRSNERRSYRSRSNERRRRSRSRSQERRNPNDVRREAQQKWAAMKAANPDFDQSDLLRQSMVEQIAEVEKQTGVTLPTYYNPATMNPMKLAEQERKKRLLWGHKNTAPAEEPVVKPVASCSGMPDMQEAIWANTRFSNDSDGKMAEKFKRLMGVKGAVPGTPGGQNRLESDSLKKQETMFVSMEKQYETARMVTHTNKGFGLGFSSQPFVPKQ